MCMSKARFPLSFTHSTFHRTTQYHNITLDLNSCFSPHFTFLSFSTLLHLTLNNGRLRHQTYRLPASQDFLVPPSCRRPHPARRGLTCGLQMTLYQLSHHTLMHTSQYPFTHHVSNLRSRQAVTLRFAPWVPFSFRP